MKNVTMMLIFLTALAVGGVLLQIFLSRRESKWAGLVLPAICLLYPLILILNVAAVGGARSVIATIVMSFVLGCIPALILLAVYFACRGSRKKKNEMEKMNIQDL